ncbi:hypothetical protein R1flu_024054 [Riccia fluitans]|uniref:Bidirectional sugar transporter SWEET n=1 Tax=Riccia fluitans TaxID=41844 RepID=A0ABD1XTT5_9MARC
MALAPNIVGIIGNIISICLFLAPAKTFVKIIKAKSTMNFKSTPYVCALLSVLLWTLYGLLKPATLIVTINAAGTFLEALFVSCFLFYSDRKGRIRTSQSLLLVLGIFGIVVAASLTASRMRDTRVMIAGVVSVIFSIIMYASPLRAMKMVIQTKSVTFMPFTLSAILLLNGLVWSLYAFLVKDIYVAIPNGVGAIFGIIQILLYLVYMNKSKKNQQLALESEKSNLQTNGAPKPSEVANGGDNGIDLEKGTLPKGERSDMEHDMKALHDNRQWKQGMSPPRADAAAESKNPAVEKTTQDFPARKTPPSPSTLPSSNPRAGTADR